MADILDSARKTISKFSMMKPGDYVIVAHSGGADSSCLLDIMLRLKGELQVSLASAHYNHGIRKETSERDREFALNGARRLRIPFYEEEGNAPALAEELRLSLEDAARRARYKFFDNIHKSIPGVDKDRVKVAMAHSANDQAETVLMRLLRGSGPKGLAGIPAVRGRYVRPLIEVKRDDIIEYLKSRDLEWIEDESNKSTDFLRNRIRHELLPGLIKDYNPRLVETLSRTARAMGETADMLSLQAAKLMGKCTIAPDHALIPRQLLVETHPAMAISLIGAVISAVKGDLMAVSSEHRVAILEAARAEGNCQLSLPGDHVADVGSEDIKIGHKPQQVEFVQKTLVVPGITYFDELESIFETAIFEAEEDKSDFPNDPMAVYLDYDKLPEPFEVRNSQIGDRFQPLGMKGSRKLQDFFVDLKVSRHDRHRTPIITAGGKIAWVAPYRISENYKITPGTRTILSITMRKIEIED